MVQTSLNSDVKLAQNLPAIKDELNLEKLWWYNLGLIINHLTLLNKGQIFNNTNIIGAYNEQTNLKSWLDIQIFRFQNNLLEEDKIVSLKNIGLLNEKKAKITGHQLINCWFQMFEINDIRSALPLKKEYLTRYEIWWYNYLLVKKCYEEKKNINLKSNQTIIDYYGKNVSLSAWINAQIARKRNNMLSKRQITYLEKLEIIWQKDENDIKNIIADRWLKAFKNNSVQSILPISRDCLNLNDLWWYKYSLARTYYQEHHNLDFSQSYKTTGYYGEIVNLGIWLSCQKNRQKDKLSDKQIQALDNIGIIWEKKTKSYIDSVNKKWQDAILNADIKSILPKNKESLDNLNLWWYNLALLKKFYQEHGNLAMYYELTVKGYYGEDVIIDRWYRHQRLKYLSNQLEPYKLEALNNICSNWYQLDRIEKDKSEIENKADIAAVKWLEAIKNNNVKSLLPDDKGKLSYFDIWWYNFALAKKYLTENIVLNISSYQLMLGFYNEPFYVGSWLMRQANRNNKNSLNEYQRKAFNSIANKSWEPDEANYSIASKWLEAIKNNNVKKILPASKAMLSFFDLWWYQFSLAYQYYQKYGCLCPNKNEIVKGYYDEDFNLTTWLTSQKRRETSGGLFKEQIKALDSIDMIWSQTSKHYRTTANELIAKKWYQAIKKGNISALLPPNKKDLYQYDLWWYNFVIAKKYANTYHNLDLVFTKTVTGFYNEEVYLGYWLYIQRKRKKANSLSDFQIKALDSINMVWKLHLSKEEEWQFNYQEVIKYKEKYGTLDIPLDYEVAYDANITINIGNWLQKQKDKFLTGKLTKEEIAKLQMIGIKLQNADSLWNEKLNAARDYYNTYGNLLVESNYKVIISTGKFNLYQWVEQQRQLYWENKLPEEEIKIFENLKISWLNLSLEWLRMYNYAKEYYLTNKNLAMVIAYKTYDVKGKSVALGSWYHKQQIDYQDNKLNSLQIELLNKIGMIWNKGDNLINNFNLCSYYHLSNMLFKNIINRYSFLELNAKICFCLDNKLHLESENEINPIFTMSSIDLKNEYNVSLEELIIKYKNRMNLVRR